MKKVKFSRIDELGKFGFELHGGIWNKKFRKVQFNVHDDGFISISVYNFFMNDFIEEITHLSNQIMYDRHDVNIMMLTLEEKEMLENE